MKIPFSYVFLQEIYIGNTLRKFTIVKNTNESHNSSGFTSTYFFQKISTPCFWLKKYPKPSLDELIELAKLDNIADNP